VARGYPRLDVVTFGRQLLDSQDLDPIYVALIKLRLDKEQLARWLVAYWCFYHAGLASFLSEQENYWSWMNRAAVNKDLKYPRGSERRHFRGAPCVRAIAHLSRQYRSPLSMVDHLTGARDVEGVMQLVSEHYMFGSWIGFKVADMLDAVWGHRLEQTKIETFLYDTPRKSIQELQGCGAVPGKSAEEAMQWLQKKLVKSRLPHRPNESPDWFALETIWCKHHSHMTGHYPLNKDIREIRHGLVPWAHQSDTAFSFLQSMPKFPLPVGALL
jgi:hypothetical protein